MRSPGTQYGGVTIPVMVMTGTLDDSPVGETTAGQRRRVYDGLVNTTRYLLVLEGGDHMVFAGRRERLGGQFRMNMHKEMAGTLGDPKRDPQFQKKILGLCTAFLNAHLKEDSAARQWLTAGNGAKAMLGQDAAAWEFGEGKSRW